MGTFHFAVGNFHSCNKSYCCFSAFLFHVKFQDLCQENHSGFSISQKVEDRLTLRCHIMFVSVKNTVMENSIKYLKNLTGQRKLFVNDI